MKRTIFLRSYAIACRYRFRRSSRYRSARLRGGPTHFALKIFRCLTEAVKIFDTPSHSLAHRSTMSWRCGARGTRRNRFLLARPRRLQAAPRLGSRAAEAAAARVARNAPHRFGAPIAGRPSRAEAPPSLELAADHSKLRPDDRRKQRPIVPTLRARWNALAEAFGMRSCSESTSFTRYRPKDHLNQRLQPIVDTRGARDLGLPRSSARPVNRLRAYRGGGDRARNRKNFARTRG